MYFVRKNVTHIIYFIRSFSNDDQIIGWMCIKFHYEFLNELFFFIPNTKSNILNNRSLVSKVTKIMCLSIYMVHVFSLFYFRNEINQKWWWYIFDRDLNILKVFECIFLCKNSNAYCITFHETTIIFFLKQTNKMQ